MGEDYIYGVARVHARETRLLGAGDIQQLMACKTCDECLRVLTDKGWGTGDGNASPEAMLAAEEEKTWAFLKELTQDLEPFQALLAPADYNNLKAAIKCAGTGAPPEHVFLPGGTIEPEVLLRCVQEQDFSPLPPAMAQAAEEAYRRFLNTQDGQLCDIILDRACLQAIQACGERTGGLVAEYAELVTAAADIKVAVRACRAGKNPEFIRAALVPCATLDTDALAVAACQGLEELYALLAATPYSQAAQRLKESSSAFEKWCDDQVMERIKEEKHSYESVGPLFAYVLARRSEISTVRIILSGKLNQLDDGMIRERLRDTYV